MSDENSNKLFKVRDRPHELHEINEHLMDELYQGGSYNLAVREIISV